MAGREVPATIPRTATAELVDEQVRETSLTAAALDADVDVQVATAKRYPRSVTTFLRRAQELAALNLDVAKSCIYAVPRDGKVIEGPSARFAEAMAAAWGNLRAKGFTAGEDDHFITGAAVAWDIENNVAIGFEVKRRITGRNGRKYSEDMVATTANAAASIALRNAILKVIPGAHWKPVYEHVRKVIAGDQKTFGVRRDEMIKAFMVMGATELRICAALGLKGKADITLDHMVTLTGFYTSLKENEANIDEIFPEVTAAAPRTDGPAQPAEPAAQAAPTASAAPAPAAPAPPAQAPVPAPDTVSVVARCVSVKRSGDRHTVYLSSGQTLVTLDLAVKRAVDAAETAQGDFCWVYKPSTDPARFASRLLEVRNPA